MKKKGRQSKQSFEVRSAISKSALADFLVKLASLYASDEFGNPALSTALRELARSVRRSAAPEVFDGNIHAEKPTPQPTPNLEFLRGLDHQSIERFIDDETKTKNELLDLATARFSIPRSQLMRMKTVEVRQMIYSALLHESSIEIISEEAKRGGSERSS